VVVLPFCLPWSATLLLLVASTASAQESQQRVLLVFGHNPNAPGAVAFSQGVQQRFVTKRYPSIEFFMEAVDYDRFPDRARWPEIARAFAAKYRQAPPHAIVAEGSAALLFTAYHLRPHFPHVPIVYGNTFDPIVDYAGLPPNITGRRMVPGFVETLDLAKRLLPRAERVVVIGGSTATDSMLLNTALRVLRPHAGDMELIGLQDWTYPSLLSALRRLPERTIVILSSFRSDLRGYVFSSGDLIASMTTVSSVPVFGIARNWVKDGVVGGAVLDFGSEGVETGRLLEAVLNRRPESLLPPPETASSPLIVDWRQLQRWGLSEAALPPGTEVLFREPGVWMRYRIAIITAAVVFLAQLTLIVLLLLERRKRQRAQLTVEEARGQVTHIARVATVGQISAAVSHELRQPLTAIHASAQAGGLLLQQPQPDVAELREIFDNIVSADERAVELIDHIRGLLRNELPQRGHVDLNQVVRQATQLLEREIRARGVELEMCLDDSLSPIDGDGVQLQQVALNLALNALDAAASHDGERRVTLGTREGITEVEMYVRNSGPGLTRDVRSHLFDAFFSTKKQGLGMGLAIVRMIVERHQGVVRGENHPEGGVVFKVILPKGLMSDSLHPRPELVQHVIHRVDPDPALARGLELERNK
jgi:signal transduction histidine kinase